MSKWTRMIVMGIGAAMLLGYGLACNTAEGVGKDTERAGEKLQDSANRNK